MITANHLGTVINRTWRPIIICLICVSFVVNAIYLPIIGKPLDATFLIALLTTIGGFATLRTVEKHLGIANRVV